MATNPPITIGPFANVPAPGSGVKSDWAQQISHYVTENLARGLVARPLVVNVDQTGIGATVTDLTGFSSTFTVVAGRWYRVEWMLETQQATATGNIVLRVSLDGAELLAGMMVQAATQLNVMSGQTYFVGGASIGNVSGVAAGTRTIKLRGATSAGTFAVVNGSVMNGRFAITDIGSTVAIP